MEINEDLKRLRIAYLVSLEYDYCPGEDEYSNIQDIFGFNVSEKYLKEILSEYEGYSADEIISKIIDLIEDLI